MCRDRMYVGLMYAQCELICTQRETLCVLNVMRMCAQRELKCVLNRAKHVLD